MAYNAPQTIKISLLSMQGAEFRAICTIVSTPDPWDGMGWKLRGLQHSSYNRDPTKVSISWITRAKLISLTHQPCLLAKKC